MMRGSDRRMVFPLGLKCRVSQSCLVCCQWFADLSGSEIHVHGVSDLVERSLRFLSSSLNA